VIALRESIPNVTTTMETGLREQAYREQLLDPSSIFDLPPSDWLTFLVNPAAFRMGHGTGFSAIAEPYVNFGFVGVLLYFVLIGYGLGRLDATPLLLHPWILLLCSATGWAFLRTVRNTMENFTRPLVFSLVVFAIWLVISRFLPGRLNPIAR
jgi:hypothetical protein